MAVAAETIQYTNIDDLPEVAAARQDIRDEAWTTLEARRQQINNGEWQYVPLPIDVLSTASKVLEARDQHGQDSAERQELSAGLWLDCHRLLVEWYRKNTGEYFPAVYHGFDPTAEDFYSHGLFIGQMTKNALTPQDTPEDEDRRVNERVEEATPQILRKIGGIALGGTRIRTISECTDAAIEAYSSDLAAGAEHRGYNGYVPEIQKVMIRDFLFDEASDGRFEEQIGLPGIYLTHEIFQEALLRRGVDVIDKDKTGLHGTQMLAGDDLVTGFLPILDAVASEQWCTNIFMGEEVPTDHPKDYDNIRVEAKARQENLESHSSMVADFVLGLAENNADPREAPAIVEKFVKKILMNMARHNTELATQIFDDKTAEGLRQVVYLESVGRSQEAWELYQKVEVAAPGGGFCGAGSCGLEAITAGSSDAADIKKLGFNAKDSIKDTERKCKCGAKTVYYDLGQSKKGCTTCGKTAKY